jgi:hypothetical protein
MISTLVNPRSFEAWVRKSVLLCMGSIRVTFDSGLRMARTMPGRPAPDPISIMDWPSGISSAKAAQFKT